MASIFNTNHVEKKDIQLHVLVFIRRSLFATILENYTEHLFERRFAKYGVFINIAIPD